MSSILVRRGSKAAVLAALVAMCVVPLACGSSSGEGGGGGAGATDGGAATSGTGAGGSGNTSGTGGSSASGGTGAGFNFDSGGDGTAGDSGTCAAETQKADLVPLDLYIMMDKSGSMSTNNNWGSVATALSAFVNDVASADLGVGLQFFPGSPECMTSTYSTPAVPIATLPGNAANIANAVAATGPGGQTPTNPALQGAIDYMSVWLIQNPTHRGVVVLATDGIPNNCASTVDNVAQIAQAGATGAPPVLTFVIGVGSQLTDLDKIAAAGGTNKAFIVDTSANVTQQFIDALNAIRGGSIACEYLIPTPEGGVIDPEKVNVTYTPGGGGQPITWINYPNEAACPPTGDGWFYDDPKTPKKVILCPNTCALVKKDSSAIVSVAFGCKKKIA